MTLKMLGAASAALLLATTAAQAAPKKVAAAASPTPSAAPVANQTPLVSGPPIANVCVYHNDAALAGSTAGRAAATRMQQLRAQVSAELQAEQQGVQKDAQDLQSKRATLTQEQLQQQAAPIQQRGEALERKAQLRQRELEATGQKALQRINVQIDPILRGIYQAHNCSLLLAGEAVLASNPSMDVTQQVVQQLDAKLPTISFDREQLPAQQQQ